MDFELDFNMDFGKESSANKRIHKPKKIKGFHERAIMYENAETLAKGITIRKGERYFSFVAGNFVFGDFIEAFCVENDLNVQEMTISTLSLAEENIVSLGNLLHDRFVKKLNLIVSDYFYSHEKHQLIPFMYDELDFENRFQLAIARSHTKTCIFRTKSGMKYVIHGSANLRSSDNIEQFDIEENETLYNYIYEFHNKIIKEYSSINKSVGGKKLWQQLQEVEEKEASPRLQNEPQPQKSEEENGNRDRENNPSF